jgi:hypothetical protein
MMITLSLKTALVILDLRLGEQWIKLLGVQIVKQHMMSIVPGSFAHGGGYGIVETVGVWMT